MYPLKWRYRRARERLGALSEWATSGEAYVPTVFFAEKIIRRVLVQLVILRGATPKKAFQCVKGLRGIAKVEEAWKNHDPQNRTLEDVIGSANWTTIKAAAKYRNELVHGSDHQAQKVYRRHRRKLLKTLDDIKTRFSSEYGYSGWKGMRDRAGNRL